MPYNPEQEVGMRAHRRWTEEEDQFLSDHLHYWSRGAIGRHLGRTAKAVEQRMARARLFPTRLHLLTSGEMSRLTGLSPQHLTALARVKHIRARRVPGGRWWLFSQEGRP